MSKKKRTTGFDPTGLSWQEVIALDPIHIKGITDKALAKATSRLVSAYNKRAKRLEQSGLAELSPSYRGLVKEGKTRLSVKGLGYNELVSVYADAKRLLTERSTFSVAGTRGLINRTADRLGYKFKTKEEALRFWDTMDRLKELGIATDKRTSDDVQREVSDMMFYENMTPDEILKSYGAVIDAQAPSAFATTAQIMGEEEENEEDTSFDY